MSYLDSAEALVATSQSYYCCIERKDGLTREILGLIAGHLCSLWQLRLQYLLSRLRFYEAAS